MHMNMEEVGEGKGSYVRPIAERIQIDKPMNVMLSSSVYLGPMGTEVEEYWDVDEVEDQGEL